MKAKGEKEKDKEVTGSQTESHNTAGAHPEPMNPKETKKMAREVRRSQYPNFTDMLITIGIFVVSLILAALVMGGLSLFKIEKELITAIVYPLQFLPVILFLRYYRKSRGDVSTGARLAPGSVNLPLTLWGILLVLVTSVVIEPLLSLFPDTYFDTIDQAVGRGGWAILTTIVVAPILEEVLFRGQILGAVKAKYGSAWALIISSVLFGLIHGIPPQMINAFFMGLILGYIYLKTGSLLSVIIIHSVNNALAYVQMEAFEDLNSGMTIREAVANDTTYYIIYGACLVLFALGVTGMLRTVKKQKRTTIVKETPAKSSESADNNNAD